MNSKLIKNLKQSLNIPFKLKYKNYFYFKNISKFKIFSKLPTTSYKKLNNKINLKHYLDTQNLKKNQLKKKALFNKLHDLSKPIKINNKRPKLLQYTSMTDFYKAKNISLFSIILIKKVYKQSIILNMDVDLNKNQINQINSFLDKSRIDHWFNVNNKKLLINLIKTSKNIPCSILLIYINSYSKFADSFYSKLFYFFFSWIVKTNPALITNVCSLNELNLFFRNKSKKWYPLNSVLLTKLIKFKSINLYNTSNVLTKTNKFKSNKAYSFIRIFKDSYKIPLKVKEGYAIRFLQKKRQKNIQGYLWKWSRKRHNQKSLSWIFKKYWLKLYYNKCFNKYPKYTKTPQKINRLTKKLSPSIIFLKNFITKKSIKTKLNKRFFIKTNILPFKLKFYDKDYLVKKPILITYKAKKLFIQNLIRYYSGSYFNNSNIYKQYKQKSFNLYKYNGSNTNTINTHLSYNQNFNLLKLNKIKSFTKHKTLALLNYYYTYFLVS